MELCHGLASNAFGTHRVTHWRWISNLHWIGVDPQQDLSGLRSAKVDVEVNEWSQRLALSRQLASLLDTGDSTGDTTAALALAAPALLGFDQVKSPAEHALYPPL